jgi:hypothetical protein
MRKAIVILALLALAGLAVGFLIWDKIYRVTPQPASITDSERHKYLYGSEGAERESGIPYWIWLVLPRIFPEYMPAAGGYLSLGLSWEETREMPVGLSKKRVGYVRVAANCALCHAHSNSRGPDEYPVLVPAASAHTDAAENLRNFYRRCAADPRFNAANILDEIGSATKLSFVDKLLYRYVLIPRTRERFLSQEPIVVDAAMWRHSRNPADPNYRPRMEALLSGLDGSERQALAYYLKGVK